MSTPRNNVVDLKLKQKVAAAPPSPVPTGKGSRTAGNQIFSEYLDKELTVPLLVLQPPPHLDDDHHNIIDHVEISSDDIACFLDLPQINYASLDSGDGSDEMDWAAAPFRLTSHGISSQELQWLVKQTDQLILPEDKVPVPEKIITFVWSSDRGRLEWAPSHVIADQTNPYFLEKIERIASKLHKIGQKLCKLLAESKDETEFEKRIQHQDCAISMYRNNPENNTTPLRYEERSINAVVDDHHHSMYFHLYPDAGPDTIVVSLDKHKDQESMRFRRRQGSSCFTIELKYCTMLSSDHDSSYSTISIRDQIMVAVIFLYIYRLYAFFTYILSRVAS